MPELDAFPQSHVITFKYYVGVIQFLEEDYAAVSTALFHYPEYLLTFSLGRGESDFSVVHVSQIIFSKYRVYNPFKLAFMEPAKSLTRLILTYLIPTLLLTRQRLPSPALLRPYPRLSTLFSPLTRAIRSGSLAAFDKALAEGETEFVKRRIYLTLERGRDICLRNLLRKVYLAAGEDEEGKRRTRIKIEEFRTAVRMEESRSALGDGMEIDGEGGRLENDEVECMIANMIYKVSPLPLLV